MAISPFLKNNNGRSILPPKSLANMNLQKSVRAFGTIKASAGNEAYVSAPTSGHLLTSASDLPKVGTHVEQGQILASLAARLSGTSDMAQLELDVQKARAADQLARTEQNRPELLFKANVIAKRRLIEAQSKTQVTSAELNAAEKRLKQTRQQSVGSASGIKFTHRSAAPWPRWPLLRAAMLRKVTNYFISSTQSYLWLEARIAEADIAQLKTPERVSFKVDGFDTEFQIQLGENGKLISYGQVIDPVTRTVPLVVEFENPQRKLSVGSLVQTSIYTDEKIPSIAVPEAALIDDNGQDVVFVQSGGESFQRRVLRLGIRDRGFVQVISGLNEGERVVTKGAYLVFLASSSPAQLGAHGHAH